MLKRLIFKALSGFSPKMRTMSEWISVYKGILDTRNLKEKSTQNKLAQIQVIENTLGSKIIGHIRPADISAVINLYADSNKMTAAKVVRNLMFDLFREAEYAEWIDKNPVASVKKVKAPVKRSRLTFDEWVAIYECAKSRHAEYIHLSMLLALVSAQRRADIVKMQHSDIMDGYLYIVQQKTGARVALPLDLRLNIINMSLGEVIKKCSKNGYFLRSHFGKSVSPHSLSQQFFETRRRVFNPDHWIGTPPSFHEIRSLAERLYRDQGINTMVLLGHKRQTMTDKYNDDRGRDWRRLML